MQLSVNLVGVVSQTLVRRSDGRGRVAAYEVLVANSAVRNLIRESKTYQINSLIQTGARQKMQTLDQSLAKLVEKGIVDQDEARTRSKDAPEFDRLLKLMRDNPIAPVPQPNAPKPETPQAPPPSTGVRGQPNRPAFRRD
jgi:twitching motility protein PilT